MNSLIGLIMLVGSYGTPADTTFHSYAFDPADGSVSLIEALTGISNPSYLALADIDASVILAVNENENETDALTMLRKSADTGRYIPVDSKRTGGAAPCHVVLSPDSTYAVTANYLGGSISIFPIDSSRSTISDPEIIKFSGHGPRSGRQDAPHAHFVAFTPENRWMVVTDLGADRLHVFPLDADLRPDTEAMHDIELKPGSGPRHLTFDRSARHAYLVNELDGTVTLLDYDADSGNFTPRQSVFADHARGEASADIHLSPDGRFLYTSNRIKGDGIVCFAVDPDDASLTETSFTPTGSHPRNFAISPDGDWLLVACRDENAIEIYRRDSETGLLTPHGDPIPCPRPVCIIFAR